MNKKWPPDEGGTEEERKKERISVGKIGWRNERIRLGPMSNGLADYLTRQKIKMNRVRISWKEMAKNNFWKEEYISPGDAIALTAADLEGGIGRVSINPRTETIEFNVKNKKTFEEIVGKGLRIEKNMMNNRKPILLKVEAFSENANTKIAIAVKDAGYYPEEIVKEKLRETNTREK